MSDAERLEILKSRYKTANVSEYINGIEVISATKDDIGWLIEQAERAQDLEVENHGHRYHISKLKKENKRLEEQLNAQAALYQRLNRDYVVIADENKRLQNEIKVVKYRKGEPTVIDWNGERWVKDSQTTFKGGVQRGKQSKSTKQTENAK